MIQSKNTLDSCFFVTFSSKSLTESNDFTHDISLGGTIMASNGFRDYYKILQVHYDASPEVIRGAYKNLCKSYHPDSGLSDSDHMALLNEAYTTLSNAASRKEYHKKWLAQHTNSSYVHKKNDKLVVFSEPTVTASTEALETFFHHLQIRDWETAYTLLTAEDKDYVGFEEFAEWREAIELCSRMQSYKIIVLRTLTDFCLDRLTYRHGVEFQVSIVELDSLTGETSTETVRKYAVYDGASWRIWLGSRNVKSATLRFRMLAEKNKNIDPMAVYHNALSRIDTLTGLLSEEGFYEDAEKEASRSKRYKNPITLLAFRVLCDNKDRETACLCQLASVIKTNCRSTDLCGRIGSKYIVCLLTETRRYSGELAARKFLKLVSQKQSESYKISYALAAYDGFTDIKNAVTELCKST